MTEQAELILLHGKLNMLTAAEEQARQVKVTLMKANAFQNLIDDAEKLELRIYYEVKRLKKKLDVLAEVAP